MINLTPDTKDSFSEYKAAVNRETRVAFYREADGRLLHQLQATF